KTLQAEASSTSVHLAGMCGDIRRLSALSKCTRTSNCRVIACRAFAARRAVQTIRQSADLGNLSRRLPMFGGGRDLWRHSGGHALARRAIDKSPRYRNL